MPGTTRFVMMPFGKKPGGSGGTIDFAKQKCLELVSAKQATHWNWYDLTTLQLIEGDAPSALRSFHYASELTPRGAVENFRSVLSNLEFLQRHRAHIARLNEAIATIRSYLPAAGPPTPRRE